MSEVSGFVSRLLVEPGVSLFRADDRVLDVMFDGWRAQILARGRGGVVGPDRRPESAAVDQSFNDFGYGIYR